MRHSTEYRVNGGAWVVAVADEEAGPNKQIQVNGVVGGDTIQLRITPLSGGPAVLSDIITITVLSDAVTQTQAINTQSLVANVMATAVIGHQQVVQVQYSESGNIPLVVNIAQAQAQQSSNSQGSVIVYCSMAQAQASQNQSVTLNMQEPGVILYEDFSSGLGLFSVTSGTPTVINGQVELESDDQIRADITGFTAGSYVEAYVTLPSVYDGLENRLGLYIHDGSLNTSTHFYVYLDMGNYGGDYSHLQIKNATPVTLTPNPSEQLLRIENRSDGSIWVGINGVQKATLAGVNLGAKQYLTINNYAQFGGLAPAVKINSVKVGAI